MATQFAGGTYINYQQFSGTYKGLIMMGVLKNLCQNTPNAGWTSLSLGAGLGPGNASVVTVTTGSPGIVNWTGHGFLGGEKIMFQVDTNIGGTFYTGLAVNTVYYVNYASANTFNVATYLGGANITITGSTNGATIWCYTQTMLLRSVAQPTVTNPIVVKLQDNLDTCVCVSIQNSAGSVVGTNDRYHGGSLYPQGFANFQITATQYWFYCSIVQSYMHNDFVYTGMIYVPSFLTGITDQGFLLTNSTDSTGNFGIYNNIQASTIIGTNTSNCQFIWNSTFVEIANNAGYNASYYPGTENLLVMMSYQYQTVQTHYRWQNDTIFMSDVFLCHGNALNTEGFIRGQFFDAVYVADAFALDSTDTFAGHTWLCTNNNNNTVTPRGGIWLATS